MNTEYKLGSTILGGIYAGVNAAGTHHLIVSGRTFKTTRTYKAAMAAAVEYVSGCHNDWELPSPADVKDIVKVIGLGNRTIWTSEVDANNAKYAIGAIIMQGEATIKACGKTQLLCVRPIRKVPITESVVTPPEEDV